VVSFKLVPSVKLSHPAYLRNVRGTGNTVSIGSQVCPGTGPGLNYCTRTNTVPVHPGTQVFHTSLSINIFPLLGAGYNH
jgi:hypothetical protein